MKFTLLFSTLLIANFCFSQSYWQEPFSKMQIQEMVNHTESNSNSNSRGIFEQLDSAVLLNFDPNSQTWYAGFTNRYAYYPDGTLKTQESETPEMFVDISNFNATGKISTRIFQNWNGTSFDDYYKTTYIYNTNNHLQSDTNYEFTGMAWELRGYSIYQVDNQGGIIEKINYQKQGSTFNPSSKFSFVLNSTGKILNLTSFQYLNGQWENNYNYFYTYNSLDRLEMYYYQTWDAGNWLNIYKSKFSFTTNNQTKAESLYWQNESWILDSKQDFQYDTSQSTSSLWVPEELGQNTHKTESYHSYFLNNSTWIQSDFMEYHYSQVEPNSVAMVDKSTSYNLISNPVSTNVRIENPNGIPSRVSIYDYTGKIVVSKKSNDALIRIDINSLQNGIYLVGIESEKEQKVFKVVVQH